MDYQATEKSHRFKIIIISVFAAVLVLAVGAWMIIAAINSVNGSPTTASEDPEVSVSEPAPTTTPTSPASQYKKDNSSKPATSSPSSSDSADNSTPAATSDIPSTGPHSVLAAAILMGISAALVGYNLQLTQRQS